MVNNNNKRKKSLVNRNEHEQLDGNDFQKKSSLRKIYIAIAVTVLVILFVFVWTLKDKKKETDFDSIIVTTKETDSKDITKQNKEIKKELDLFIPDEAKVKELESAYIAENENASEDYLDNFEFYSFVQKKEKLTDEELGIFQIMYSSNSYFKAQDSVEDKKMKIDAVKWYLANEELVSINTKSDLAKYLSKHKKSVVYDAPSVIDTQKNNFVPIGDYFSYTLGFTETENIPNLYRGHPYIENLEEGISRITVNYLARGNVSTSDLEEEASHSIPNIEGVSSRGYSAVFPKESYKKLNKDIQECVYGKYVVPECEKELSKSLEKLEGMDETSDEYAEEVGKLVTSDKNILNVFTGSLAKEELQSRKHSEFINYDLNVGKELYQGVVYKAVYYIKTEDIKLPMFKLRIGENIYDMAHIENNEPLYVGIDFNWS